MTGLNLELELAQQDERDWIFGGFSQPGLFNVPSGRRKPHLPQGELQFGVDDYMDCASRAPLNILETQFSYAYQHRDLSDDNRKWLKENGYVVTTSSYGLGERILFSDRFIAILSDTTRQGNSFKAPLEAIRKHGLIPKRLLPTDPADTFEEHHDEEEITDAMLDLGEEFATRFTINYDRVQAVHFAEALKDDMLIVSGYAWPVPVNGIYPRSPLPPNHAFILYLPQFYAFDNYIDRVDGDFTKRLAKDFSFFEYGYRVYVSAQNAEKRTLLKQVMELLTKMRDMLLHV